jgi:hypothetical protein
MSEELSQNELPQNQISEISNRIYQNCHNFLKKDFESATQLWPIISKLLKLEEIDGSESDYEIMRAILYEKELQISEKEIILTIENNITSNELFKDIKNPQHLKISFNQ